VSPELETYLDQLLSIKQDAPGIVGGLSREQFFWRPAPNRWSIAECFGHLNRASKLFLPFFDQAIDAARAAALTGSGPFAYPLLERMALVAMEPPARIRFRAPAGFTWLPDGTTEEVLQEFRDWQDRFGERIRRADGLDLRRARVQSAAARWLRYSLGTGFALMLAHERRHLWQARQVRNTLDGTKNGRP
jgi:hypothetical protein